jgi:hypothetical protein
VHATAKYFAIMVLITENAHFSKLSLIEKFPY